MFPKDVIELNEKFFILFSYQETAKNIVIKKESGIESNKLLSA